MTALALLNYLLCLALGKDSALTDMPTAQMWRHTFMLAKKHNVVAIAWDGLLILQQHTPQAFSTLSQQLLGQWFADTHAIESVNRGRVKQIERVQDDLLKQGFSSIVLKGSSLAKFYPEPLHRQSSDIDLWLLSTASYHAQRTAIIDYLRSANIGIEEVVYHHIVTNYFPSAEVELHVTPTWLCSPWRNRRLQEAFRQEGSRLLNGGHTMSASMMELYMIVHAFRHIYHDGLSLRHMLDYYLVRENNRRNSVPAPSSLLRDIGLATFASAMDEVTNYLFGGVSAYPQSLLSQHLLSAIRNGKYPLMYKLIDYPIETLCNPLWRVVHRWWRITNHYLSICEKPVSSDI